MKNRLESDVGYNQMLINSSQSMEPNMNNNQIVNSAVGQLIDNNMSQQELNNQK